MEETEKMEISDQELDLLLQTTDPETDEAALQTEEEQVPVSESKEPAQPKAPRFKCKGKKWVLIAVVAIAVIAAVVAAVLGAAVLFGEKLDNYGLYVRDYEIHLVDDTADNKYAVTNHLSLDDELSKDDCVELAEEIGQYIVVTGNGNRIFFPDKIDGGKGGINLYYRDLGSKDDQPVRIDSEVRYYRVNSDGSKVIYIKGSEQNLYVHDLKQRVRIATNVKQASVAENCDKVAFLDKKNDFYLWESGKEITKLATEVDDLYYHPDMAYFYYDKEDIFYKQTLGSEDREKLAENLSQIICAYDSGELFYVKENVLEIDYADYVNDDKLQEDKELKEPVKPTYPKKPTYPYSWYYKTNAAYQEAYKKYQDDLKKYEETCDKLKKEYEEACARYEEKVFRDKLRESLKDAKENHTQYFLYYHNGTEEVLLTDALTKKTDIDFSSNKAVAFYSVYNSSEVQKVKLSELESVYEVKKLVNDALYSASDIYIAVGANASLLEENEATNMVISPDCGTIYFLDNVTDNGSADLYRMAVSTTEGTIGLPELYDSKVSSHYPLKFIREDSRIVYMKNVRMAKNMGDLYISGQLLDYDVALNGITYLENSMAYFADWNEDKEFGVLKIRKIEDQTDTLISEDVHEYIFTSAGDILYLKDYRVQYDSGDLYFYSRANEESQKVAYEVVALVKPADAEEGIINSRGLSTADTVTVADITPAAK